MTRDRFRFSRGSPLFPVAVDDERVRCGPEECSFVAPSVVVVGVVADVSTVGESGAVSEEADRGTLSAGVRGDIEALGDEAEDDATTIATSSFDGSSLRAGFGSMQREGTFARFRSPDMLSTWSSVSLAV